MTGFGTFGGVRRPASTTALPPLWWLGIMAASAACTSDMVDPPPGGGSNTDSVDTTLPDTGGPDPEEPPVYVVQTGVNTPDGRTVYMHLLDSLAGSLDPSLAVEFSGASRVRAAFGDVFSFDSETLEVTKWRVTDDLLPVEVDRFSMMPTGIQGFNGNVVFASETQAITVNGGSSQFVVWNPEAMKIVTTVPFPDELLTGARSFRPVLDTAGQRMFVPFLEASLTTLETVPGARVVILDLNTNTVESVLKDTRVAGGDSMFVHPQTGDVIYVGDSLGGFAHHLGNPNDSVPGLLRIGPGESTFDPDWMLTGDQLNSAGFQDIGSFGGLLGIGDRYVLSVRDEVASPDPSTFASDPFGFFASSQYALFAGPIDDWSATPVTVPEGVEARFTGFSIDDRFIVGDLEGTLYFITEDNELDQFNAIELQGGFLEFFAQLR